MSDLDSMPLALMPCQLDVKTTPLQPRKLLATASGVGVAQGVATLRLRLPILGPLPLETQLQPRQLRR